MRDHCVFQIKRAGVCLAAVLLLCGCGGKDSEDPMVIVEGEQAESAYELATAVVSDIELTQRVYCTYKQLKDQEVSFGISGRIVEEVYVQEGSSVKKGDLLAQLSDGSLEQDIARLEYNIARNELLLSYLQLDQDYEISGLWLNYLYHSGQSRSDKERLEAAVENVQKNYRYRREDYNDALELDRIELEKLRRDMEQNRIYAGIDGMVYKIKENLEGSTSRAGETVITLIDNSQCVFEMQAPEYAHCFREGEGVSMRIASGSAIGEYELLPWNMEEWGENQFFVISSGAEGANIEVGTMGTMTVVTDSRYQVLCVPVEAVHSADGRYYVYVIGQDDLREVKWVETGLFGNTLVEITGGLEEGERVIMR